MGPPRRRYISGICVAFFLPIGGIICNRSHFLGEPETTIEKLVIFVAGTAAISEQGFREMRVYQKNARRARVLATYQHQVAVPSLNLKGW